MVSFDKLHPMQVLTFLCSVSDDNYKGLSGCCQLVVLYHKIASYLKGSCHDVASGPYTMQLNAQNTFKVPLCVMLSYGKASKNKK